MMEKLPAATWHSEHATCSRTLRAKQDRGEAVAPTLQATSAQAGMSGQTNRTDVGTSVRPDATMSAALLNCCVAPRT